MNFAFKWILSALDSHTEMKILKIHLGPVTTVKCKITALYVSYLWKDSFSVNWEERGFPPTLNSSCCLLDPLLVPQPFWAIVYGSFAYSTAFLGNCLWKDGWQRMFPLTPSAGRLWGDNPEINREWFQWKPSTVMLVPTVHHIEIMEKSSIHTQTWLSMCE